MNRYIRFMSMFLPMLLSLAHPVAAQQQLSQNMDGFESSSLSSGTIDPTSVKDSTVVEREVPKDYTQWVIDPVFGSMEYQEPDTLMDGFYKLHLTEGTEMTYSHLGNMGSPRLSRLFFEREPSDLWYFDTPYDYFVKNPSDFLFTDTKTPHVNITYFKGGDKQTGEEHIKGYFAANFGKKTGIGFDLDYLLGRGRYDSQSTSMFDARIYFYHHRDAYNLHATFNHDEIKVAENGGIEDDRYITNPEAMSQGRKEYDPEDIPVVLSNNWNNLKRSQMMLSQSFDIRRVHQVSDSIGDTVLTHNEYVAVSTLSHTLEAGELKRRHIAYTTPSDFYQHQYLPSDSIDLFRNLYIDNTLSLSLNEGFSSWAVAGLKAYLRYEFLSLTQPDTTSAGQEYRHRENMYNIVAGGVINHEKSEHLTMNVSGETVLAGSDFGDIDLSGAINLEVPFLGRNARLTASGQFAVSTPDNYLESFHSEHIWWDNDFTDKEILTQVNGELEIEKTRTLLRASVANINNHVYLADTGTSGLHEVSALQHSGSIRVFSTTLDQQMVLGPLHWDNNITYQITSDAGVLPLPDLNVYSNLYLKFTYAKQLRMEVGADLTYFTEYYASDYSPAAGQFVLQNTDDRVKVGGYPLASAYVNCVLRGVRFYVMLYHFNDGLMSNRNSFWAPHYPIAPSFLKFGLSWTFFD